MIEILDFNIRGRKDLTEQCFKTMQGTVDWSNVWVLILDASLKDEDQITDDDMRRWVPLEARHTLLKHPGYGLSLGWDTSIGFAHEFVGKTAHDYQLWQMNNDLLFKKPGWLEKMSTTLQQPGVGEVGSGDMKVFGHHFVTGAIAGFNLGTVFEIIPSGEIMDLELNYAYADVALSILIERAGYETRRVQGIEWGDNPYVVHLISQTVYLREGYDMVMKYRAVEGRRFVEKFGRLDGKPLYDGI